MTLDPPGSIAVVGAGPLGIEAALYGRFLGYDITLIEAVAVGQSMISRSEELLPMFPNQCLSPLAMSALEAQRAAVERVDTTQDPPLPMTYGQWIREALVPLTETDLLRDRVRAPVRVTGIAQVPVEAEDGEDTNDIPADYRLMLCDQDAQTRPFEVESVILAVGTCCDIELKFEQSEPYFFRIGATTGQDHEQDLKSGLREIVAVFATLAGRADLDLYRPRRL